MVTVLMLQVSRWILFYIPQATFNTSDGGNNIHQNGGDTYTVDLDTDILFNTTMIPLI